MYKLESFDSLSISHYCEQTLSPHFLKLGFHYRSISQESTPEKQGFCVLYDCKNPQTLEFDELVSFSTKPKNEHIRVKFEKFNNTTINVRFQCCFHNKSKSIHDIFSFIPHNNEQIFNFLHTYLTKGRELDLFSDLEDRTVGFPKSVLDYSYQGFGVHYSRSAESLINFSENILTRVIFNNLGQYVFSGKKMTKTSIINSKVEFFIIDGILIPFLKIRFSFSQSNNRKILISLNSDLSNKAYLYIQGARDIEEIENIENYIESNLKSQLFRSIKNLFEITKEDFNLITQDDMTYYKNLIEISLI